MQHFTVLVSFAAVVLAQNATVTWLAGHNPGDYTPFFAGSIISACPGTTILAAACTSASGAVDQDTCGTDAPVRPPHVPPSATLKPPSY